MDNECIKERNGENAYKYGTFGQIKGHKEAVSALFLHETTIP